MSVARGGRVEFASSRARTMLLPAVLEEGRCVPSRGSASRFGDLPRTCSQLRSRLSRRRSSTKSENASSRSPGFRRRAPMCRSSSSPTSPSANDAGVPSASSWTTPRMSCGRPLPRSRARSSACKQARVTSPRSATASSATSSRSRPDSTDSRRRCSCSRERRRARRLHDHEEIVLRRCSTTCSPALQCTTALTWSSNATSRSSCCPTAIFSSTRCSILRATPHGTRRPAASMLARTATMPVC